MRVGFAGTPEFARTALQAVHAAGFPVPLVLTQPDRPAGRGMQLQPSPVKRFALDAGLPVAQPRSLRLDGRHPDDARAAQAALEAAACDVLVVAAYGLLLPAWVLALPRHGCLNIHGSLLPRWRGAAPVQRAIEAGDATTGIALMQMDEGLDTGAVLRMQAIPIAPDDTAQTLMDRLAALGAEMLVPALHALPTLCPVPQPAEGVSHAKKIDKAEAALDWRQPAEVLERRLRAFDPFPGCTLRLGDETVKAWRGRVVEGEAGAEPGTVLAAGEGRWVVACGAGALELLQVQRTGARRVAVRDFLHGCPVPPGSRLG